MSFIGCDFPQHELDAATVCLVDSKHLRTEAELFNSKWWDYRLIHPLTATYMFAHEYKKAIKAGLRVRSDLYKAANYKGLKHEDFLQTSKSTITGMWKARQRADKEGVPYDFWCRSAMKFAEQRQWKYLPKPTQLYSDKPYVDSDVSMASLHSKPMERGEFGAISFRRMRVLQVRKLRRARVSKSTHEVGFGQIGNDQIPPGVGG